MTQPKPASTIFADHMDRLREHARLAPAALYRDAFIRLLNEHPALHVEPGGPDTPPSVSITLTRPAAPGKPVGAFLASPAAAQAAVNSAKALHDALTGRGGGSVFRTPPTQSALHEPMPGETPEDEARGRRLEYATYALQEVERSHALRLLSKPHDAPPSPEALEWVAGIIDIWALETPHHLDRRDPEGWGPCQSLRAGRAGIIKEMALDAARHWRAGTPGTDAEDAPAVAWLGLRAFAMNLQADQTEARAFGQMLP